ncbi:MAG: hypothetical protein WCD20_01200, partial [Rhodomicrobium sp.]
PWQCLLFTLGHISQVQGAGATKAVQSRERGTACAAPSPMSNIDVILQRLRARAAAPVALFSRLRKSNSHRKSDKCVVVQGLPANA